MPELEILVLAYNVTEYREFCQGEDRRPWDDGFRFMSSVVANEGREFAGLKVMPAFWRRGDALDSYRIALRMVTRL